MKTFNSSVNKLDIYVDAQMLYKQLYLMQKRITKNDRKHLYPWILISSLDMAKYISLAKRVVSKQLEYIETALSVFETIKLVVRSCIDLSIIKFSGDKIELFNIIARIDKSFDKWYSYKSDMMNKSIIKIEQKRKEELKNIINEAIYGNANVSHEQSTEITNTTVKPMLLSSFIKNHPIFMNRDSYEMISKNVHDNKSWLCIYGSSQDDMTKGSIRETAASIPGFIGTFSQGSEVKHACIYRYEHGIIVISGTKNKTVINYVITGSRSFLEMIEQILLYDKIDFENIIE